MKDENLLNLYGLSRELNLPVKWLKDKAVEGHIPCLRIGRRFRFNIEAVSSSTLGSLSQKRVRRKRQGKDMKSKEIEKIKRELKEINQKPFENRGAPLQKIATDIGANMPISAPSSQTRLYTNIHMVLQTEMMLNACVFAKRSCFWAAIAAIAACISVVLVLFLG